MGMCQESWHEENSHIPLIFGQKKTLPQIQLCRFPFVSYWPEKGHMLTPISRTSLSFPEMKSSSMNKYLDKSRPCPKGVREGGL